MFEAIIIASIGAFQTVLVAFIARNSQRQKKSILKMEALARMNAEQNSRSMSFMSANLSLSKSIALTLAGQKINGQIDKALEEAESAQGEYFKLVNEVAAAKMAGVPTEEFSIFNPKKGE